VTELFYSQYLRLENYFQAGGITMIPLAAVSLVMWLLIVDRTLFFKRLQYKNMDTQTASEHLRDNRLPDPELYRGAISLLVANFISRRVTTEKPGSPTSVGDRRKLDGFILDETVLSLNRSLNNYLAIIGVLATIAPLLGLLGTVIGMITTFDILSIFGTGNAKGMASGISEALITTQTGLLVAIPGLYMKNFLDRRAQRLKQHISQVAFYLHRQII
jgi:biopolymer transport protein ExbB